MLHEIAAIQRSSRRPVIGQQSQAERISQDLVYRPQMHRIEPT